MDWIMENWRSVLAFVTGAVAVGVFLYRHYRGKRDALLRDALEYLKGWAGDRLAGVTEAEVYDVADLLYNRLVAGTALEKIISREYMRATLWQMFVEWRGWFIAMRASIIEGGA